MILIQAAAWRYMAIAANIAKLPDLLGANADPKAR
jgi:hypothetical protein